MAKKNGPVQFKNILDSNEYNDALPTRNQQCKNYSVCLNIAASLDWDGFDCTHCNKTINEQLIWRAQSAQRNDAVTKKIFPIPKIQCIINKKKEEIKKVS